MKLPMSGMFETRRVSDEAPLVLLVDDYGDAGEMYAFYLRRLGFRTALAVTAEEALAVAIQLRPSVIVMDLTSPEEAGLAATRALHATPWTARIPVILLSCSPVPEIRAEAHDAGAGTFLAKPCLPSTLATEVARVVARQRETHAPTVTRRSS